MLGAYRAYRESIDQANFCSELFYLVLYICSRHRGYPSYRSWVCINLV